MTTNKIFEDLPSRRDIPAAAPRPQKPGAPQRDSKDGPDSEEKRIRQAVYDIRYRARREEIPLAQAFSQYMQNASLNGAEKLAVRKKLFEEYEISNMISDNIATAMYKVFVEGSEESRDEYFEELAEFNKFNKSASKKYKVRVTDKDNRSYVRYATREKIQQLRANPNIKEVEMTEYGTPYEGERNKGEQTAKALGGGPNKKPNDGNLANNYPPYDKVTRGDVIAGATGKDQMGGKRKIKEANDGNLANNYPPYDKVTRGDVIAGATGKDQMGGKKTKKKVVDEEFIDEKLIAKDEGKKITGKGVNNKKRITIYPTLDNKIQTEETIAEKAVSTAQQKFFGMVHAYKSGKMSDASPEVKKAAKTITDTEAEKFASTKHKGLPGHVKKESVELDEAGMPIIVVKKKSSDKSDPNMTSDLKKINPDDPRADFAKDQKVKNTLRAMGAKSVMTVGEELHPSLKRMESQAKENIAKIKAAKAKKADDVAEFQAHKKDVLAKGGRPVDALDSWQKKKMKKEEVDTLGEDQLAELTRYAKETGKSFRTGRPTSSGGTIGGSDTMSQALRSVMKSMGSGRAGVQPRGKKKVPGQKPPAAGEYGSERRSPEQIVKNRRAQRQAAQDMMHSRFD